MLNLSPELIQVLLTAAAFLLAWWLRGRGISLPPLPGPKPEPKPDPTPAPVPPLPDLLNTLRQLEPLLPLLLKLLQPKAPGQFESLATEAPPPAFSVYRAESGSVVRVEYEIPPLVPKQP